MFKQTLGVLAIAAILTLSLGKARAQTSVAPPPPSAPSSVTLYGILDVAAYDKQLAGESKLKTLQSGSLTTSRFGFTGSENLGGGLRAVFDMSSFIRVDSGDYGRTGADPFWARYSYVGLTSDDYGALRLGRISTATFLSEVFFGAFLDSTTLGPYLLHTFVGSGGQPMLTGNGLLDSAWSNSISYSLPAIKSIPGLTASVQVAASEGTNGRRIGGGLQYRGDVVGATLTFDNVRNGVLAVGAPSAAAATAARPLYTANTVQTYQGGAYYDFKIARVWAQHNQTTFKNATPVEIKLVTSALSATVPFGLSSFIAEWAHTTDHRTGVQNLSRNTESVGYDYFLSKRTDLYAVAIHDKVTNLSSGTGWAAGVRHRF